MNLLRPGLHVVRRDDRHLQVGLDPPWRLVVPDEPDVRAVLDDLVAGRPPAPATPAGQRVLHELREAGMLRSAALTRPSPTGRVAVVGLVDRAADVVRLLGDRVTRRPRQAAAAVVVCAGEPPREAVDEHMRAGTPHLVVSAGPRGYRVGPFVDPGTTACLRCVDAHLGEHDPRRAVVVEQLVGRTTAPDDPDDPALWALAAAWAARDVRRYLSGARPSSWSTTVDLPVDGDPVITTWARHPYCGCCWAHPLAG